jgi:NitT/TauT family transport system ATP-binding protein
MSLLEIVDVAKTYGTGAAQVQAIGRIAFSVGDEEFVSVVGPSGCGKTTLLKCISGLMAPSSGQTLLRGRPVTEPPPELAIVFQDYARSLFPWMTVRRNVALPLRRRPDVPDAPRVVTEALEAVGLARFADHYPWQLSGGMQQRVAIARALAYQPKVLLMDEPFASVDAQTRADLEDLVLEVRRRFRMTVLLVTHDIDESVYMADRVVVLSGPPSTVQEVLEIDLPPERDQVTTKEMAEFVHLRARIYLAIKGNGRAARAEHEERTVTR